MTNGGISMDITALPGALIAADVNNQISTALLSKSLDTVEEMGDGMIKMMEQSVYPNLGQNIDVLV